MSDWTPKLGDRVRSNATGTKLFKRQIVGTVTHIDPLEPTVVKVLIDGEGSPSDKRGRTIASRHLEPTNG